MSVIFDLDQTLIDSSSLKELRKLRDWPEINRQIGRIAPFPYIEDILQFLRKKEIKVGIVTSSPREYCQLILQYLQWRVDCTVCLQDTIKIKPSASPILKAMRLMGVSSQEVLTFGDDARDILAAQRAQVWAGGCLWGGRDPEMLLRSRADAYFRAPQDLLSFLKSEF